MSVLIKGMEMPKSCAECPLLESCSECEGYHNRCMPLGVENGYTDYPDDLTPTDRRRDDCPLAPVPPHGRLIEAEPLETTLETFAYKNDGRNYSAYIVAKAWVKNAPTIIPAEEGVANDE